MVQAIQVLRFHLLELEKVCKKLLLSIYDNNSLKCSIIDKRGKQY